MEARSLSMVLAVAAPLFAQAPLVLPPSHALREGTTSTNVPFGRSTPVRVQSLYDPTLFAAPGTITALAFRLDGDQVAGQKQVDCEIRMSTAALSLVNMAADFAGNRGQDEVVVLPRQIVTLPAMGAVASPSPFLAPIALVVPFHYDPQIGPLLIEVVVFGQPPGAYSLDATFVCDSPETAVGPLACTPLQGQQLRVESATTQVMWGRPWLVRALDAPPGALVVLGLGATDTGTWNGAPLPVSLEPIGATGCFVAIDIADVWFQQVLGDGSATFAFAVPNQPTLVGLWVYFQAGAFSAPFNAFGFVSSRAKKVQVCGFEPVARLWSSGITATLGVREIGTAPVVQITIQ